MSNDERNVDPVQEILRLSQSFLSLVPQQVKDVG